MIVASLPTGPLAVNCYLVGCETTKKAAIIDPGGDVEQILALLNEHQLTAEMIINTHGHFDHIGGNSHLVAATGCKLMIHRDDAPLLTRANQHAAMFGLKVELSPEPNRLLADNDVIELGQLTIKVIHTPGHSPGGVCLAVEDYLFVGDTLFSGSIGRTDLPAGDHLLLIHNIKEKLLIFDDKTKVCPGHGPMTTIGRERQYNPFLN